MTHKGEQDLPGDPRGRQHGLQGENGPPQEVPGEEGSCVEGYWDDLDEDGVSGRVALFLANLRSRSNLTYSTLNFIISRTTDLIVDIVERIKTKT